MKYFSTKHETFLKYNFMQEYFMNITMQIKQSWLTTEKLQKTKATIKKKLEPNQKHSSLFLN
jgi:hypothetical protein